MYKIKRLTAAILAVILMLSTMPLTTLAHKSSQPFSFSDSESVKDLKSYLTGELAECKEEVNLSRFNIQNKDSQLVYDLIVEEIPEAFHFDKSALRIFYTSGDFLSHMTPTYKMVDKTIDVHTYEAMLEDMEDSADKILKGIEDNKSLSQTEKALLIHDRLIVHNSYDWESYTQANKPGSSFPNSHKTFTAYAALVDGLSVCDGYTKAYDYLLGRVGIESKYCSSVNLKHAWNIVTVDNKDYYVDTTSDESYDLDSTVRHNFFLVSSAELYKLQKAEFRNGKTFDVDYEENQSLGNTITDRYWDNSTAEFQLIGDSVYYLNNVSRSLCKVNDIKSLENASDIHKYSVLTNDGSNLIYNTASEICYTNLKTNTAKVIFKDADCDGITLIVDIKYDDEAKLIRYTTFDTKKEKYTEKSIVPYTVSIDKADFYYSKNKVQKPTVMVYDLTGNQLKSGYTVDYSNKNSTLKGKYTLTVTIKNTKHRFTYSIHQDADGDWTKTDKTYHWHKCSCGKVFDYGKHTFKTLKQINPTCVKSGWTAGKQCTVCGYTEGVKQIKPTGKHSPYVKKGSGYASTCTKYGRADGTYCRTCNNLLAYGKTLAKKSHTYKTISVKDATTTKNGTITKSCTSCKAKSYTTIRRVSSVKLSATSYTYNGRIRKPTVTVRNSAGTKLTLNKDYKLTYSKGLKNIGRYTVKVTFIGNYTGSKTLSYSIIPNSTKLRSARATKKGVVLSWTKLSSSQVSGYEVQYSTNRSFKGAKTLRVKGNVSSKTVKISTKYRYFRIRTYKTTGGRTYYSKWR